MKKHTQIQNGIQIREKNFETKKQKNKRSIGFLFLSFLCLWMASFGIFYGMAATFGVSVGGSSYFFLSFAICLFWTGVLQIKRWFGVIFVLILILYLYLFYIVWDRTWGGFSQIYNAVIAQMNQYYQLQLGIIPIQYAMSSDVLWALGMVSFLPSGILAVGTMKKSRPALIFVLEAVPVVLALLLGLVVPLLPSIAMAFSLFGSLWISGLRKRRKKKDIQLGMTQEATKRILNQISMLFLAVFVIAAVFAMLFGNRVLEPKLRQLDDVRVEIQNSSMEDLWVEWTEELTSRLEWLLPGDLVQSGGISGGKMGKIEAWNNTNAVHLRVYSDTASTSRLYLKAYVGSYYEDNEWRPLDSYPDLPGLEIQSMGWDSLERNASANSNIIVDNVGASSLYSYVPYYSDVMEFQQDIMDATIRKQGRRSRTYSVRMFDMDEMIFRSEFTSKQRPDWYEQYEEWVYRQYLQLPEEGIERMIADYQVSSPYSADLRTVEYVREILNRHATYSTNPGITPDGEDFNEYFLYEQQKGLCMHFASAGTILFRILGVPARYVEGYIVPQLAAGRVNEVLDSHAHAWVEIWKGELGWVPVEVTPGYEIDTEIVPAEQAVIEEKEETREETTETATSQEEETSVEETSTMQNQPENNANQFRLEVWKLILIIGFIAVFVIAVAIIRSWRYRKMRRTFVGEKRKAVAAIASATRKIQQVSGQTWNDCKIEEMDIKWLEQLALKARFSQHPIDRQEVQRAADLYWNLADRIFERSSLWMKFKIKWIYCFK